jgi:hypothetical protein
LQAEEAAYHVRWYDPMRGGELQTGDTLQIRGHGYQSLGAPPQAADQDWVILLKKVH